MDDDGEAIAGSLAGDPQAFGAVFERHATAVLRFVVRRLPPSEAEAVLADVFRVAFERRASFDLERPLRPWLFGIAANVVARHHRSEARRLAAVARYASQADERTTDPGERTSATIDARDSAARVLAVLAGLRPEERSVVLLHAWEDLSYAEIADVLEIPIGTVRSRLSRARAKVRTGMDDVCEERP